MGIPTVKVKLLAYAIGAAMGGVSGAFLGAFLEGINADQFQFSFSIFVLAMIILGGLGSIWGVIVGAVALSLINFRLIPDVLNPISSDLLGFDLTHPELRHLRLPARDHDGAATAGPDTRETAGDRAHRGHRRRRRTGGDVTMSANDRAARDAGPDEDLRRPGRRRRGVLRGARRAASCRSSGPTAPARRRSSTCSPACTSRRSARSPSTARTSRAAGRTRSPRAASSRTFQNIRLFGTMTAVENVMVGAHARMKTGAVGAIFRPPWTRHGGARRRREGPRAARVRRRQAALARQRGDQPLLRRPAPRGDRPRAGVATRSCCCSTSRRPA